MNKFTATPTAAYEDLREVFFDGAFYSLRYGIANEGFAHYCAFGWKSGYQPNPFFCPVDYARYHDLASDQEPLAHLVDQGEVPPYVSPMFDASGYDRLYGRIIPFGMNRFAHFLSEGQALRLLPGFTLTELAERRTQAPNFAWNYAADALGFPIEQVDAEAAQRYLKLVEPSFYEAAYGSELGDLGAAEHYAAHGARKNYAPNAFFDAIWYKIRYGLGDKVDALWDHVLTGQRPAPFFCIKSYAAANSGVAPVDAYTHFVSGGAARDLPLGLNGEQIAILRKVDPNFDWARAESNYQFPSPPEKPASMTNKPAEVLKPAREAADRFHLDGFDLRARNKSIVSFDIWDTLLRRKCDPDAIKLYAAAAFHTAMRRTLPLLQLTIPELFRLRQLAEFRVADLNYEYRYNDMIWEWTKLAGVLDQVEAAAIVRHVERAEFEREMAITWVDPTALAMLQTLKARGVALIAISDFYLPGTRLEVLLRHHGLDTFIEKVYASCDVLKTKREGGLFDYVQELEGIDASHWLHVGDNKHADFTIPKARGIDAYLFTDELELKRKEVFQCEFELSLLGDGMTFLDGIGNYAPTQASDKLDYVANLRREICEFTPCVDSSSVEQLAIVIAGFARFILEKGCEQGVDTIYFATREGNFLLEACSRLIRADILHRGTNYPDLRLLEVSRRATFVASLRETTISEMMRLWSLYSQQSMQALARTLNVDEVQMEAFCQRHEVPFATKLTYPWTNPKVCQLFSDFEFCCWLKERINQQRSALWEYLEKIGFAPGANVKRMMVDIGWRGSIQDNLAFIVNGELNGAYLALYEYLVEQPGNARKFGFLMDRNAPGEDDYDVGDFAALEFISNGPGGSVSGYRDGMAIRQTFADEEALLAASILPLQERILDEMEGLVARFGRVLGDSSVWRSIARHTVKEYVSRPDAEISQAFLQLEHNETFGLGEIDRISSDSPISLGSLQDLELHGTLRSTLASQRWPQTWLRQERVQAELSCLSLGQRLVLPRGQGIGKAPALVRSLGFRVAIYAPEPIWGSGGHRTIYNFAKALDTSGFNVDVFSERRGNQYAYKEQELAGHSIGIHDHWFNGIVPNAGVATINYSSYYLSRSFNDSVSKFYFVQDFEAAFNPVSDGYVRGENSFAEGHSHLCVGRWLPHVLRTQFGSGAMGSGLGIDPGVYWPSPDAEHKDRIVVLFQPEKWRRLPEHCLEALAIVKARRPQTEVVFYGSQASPACSFSHTHLGLINDLEALNGLYNSARIGLCISLTNPSRIPYEMMAAGCVPVDVYRYNNLFDYGAGTGLLAYQSATSIAEAMLHLLSNDQVWQTRQNACLNAARHRTLAWETDGAVNALEFVLDGGDLKQLPVPKPTYTDEPFLALEDTRAPVQAWCSAQWRMAHDG